MSDRLERREGVKDETDRAAIQNMPGLRIGRRDRPSQRIGRLGHTWKISPLFYLRRRRAAYLSSASPQGGATSLLIADRILTREGESERGSFPEATGAA